MKCELCASDKLDSIRYGEFLTKNGKGVHTNCLYLSSGLKQSGEDDQGFLGFLPKDIAAERKRVYKIQCCYCGEMSANIGCCESRCYRNFHMICGLENGAMNQFLHTFRSFCHKHVRKSQSRPKATDDCGICYDNIFNGCKRFKTINILRATCCRNGWFHKYCVQKFAKMAGYFFKCPLCNDSQKFKKDMSYWGIFIHDKDADWELVPNAFAELLERPNVCAAQICYNAEGRGQKKNSNPFIFCLLCGSVAMHRQCVPQNTKSFECDSCKKIINSAPSLSNQKEQEHNVEASEQNTENENSDVDICGDSENGYLSCDDFIRPSSKKRNLKQIIRDDDDDDDEYEDATTTKSGIIAKNTSEEIENKTDCIHDENIANCVKTDHCYDCNNEIVLNGQKRYENQNKNEKNNQKAGSVNLSCIAKRKRRKSMLVRPPSREDLGSEPDESSFTSSNHSSDDGNSSDNCNVNVSNCVKSDHSYACIELSDDDDEWTEKLAPQLKTDNIEKFGIDDKESTVSSLATKRALSECEQENYAFKMYCAAQGNYCTSLDECPTSIKYETEANHLNTSMSSCQSTKWYKIFQYDDGNDTDNEYDNKIAKPSPQRENSEPKVVNPMDISCIANRTRRRSSFKKQSLPNDNISSNAHAEIVDGDHSSVCSADSYQAHRHEDNVAFDYEADENSEAEYGDKNDVEKQHYKTAGGRLINYFHRLLREVKCNSKLNMPNTLENVDMKTDEKNILEISCIANGARRRSSKGQKSILPDLGVEVEKPIQSTSGGLTDSHTLSTYHDKTIDCRDTNFKAESACKDSIEHRKSTNTERCKQREAQKRKSELRAKIPSKIPLLSTASSEPKVATNISEVSCIANRPRRKSVDVNTYLSTLNAREKTNTDRETKSTKAYNSLSSCESSSNDLSAESPMCENSNDCDLLQAQSILSTATRPSRRRRTVPRRFRDSEDEYETITAQTKMPKLANWANVKETTEAYMMPRYKRVNGKLKKESPQLSQRKILARRTPFARSYNLLLETTDVNPGTKRCSV